MSTVGFEAMGTVIEAWGGDGHALRAWFEEVEAVCSRFRPTSELTRINNAGAGRHPVSPLLRQVLEAADRARSITDGLVDVGVGAAVAAWGYDRTFSEVRAIPEEPSAVTPEPGWSVLRDSIWLDAGTGIDLGGVAKGWTCDRAVENGLVGVVSAGGDIRSADPDTVATIADSEGAVVARVAFGVGALATSSVARRRWTAGGRDVSHIIDPRSMRPVTSPIVSASVIARTAVDAEAGAKAVLIHGVDGLSWADSQEWIESALVVWDDGAVYATGRTEWAA